MVLVGTLAVLLAEALPGVDGCALAAASEHACCAEAAPEPASSCCSTIEAKPSHAEAGHQTGCDCIHPPSTPADMVTSTVSTAPNDDTSPDLRIEDRHLGLSLQKRGRVTDHLVRIRPPLPVHLLNCSFLI